MFEAYTLLARLRDYFGYDCSVVMGIYERIVSVSVSWGECTVFYDLDEETLQYIVSSDLLEQMVIQHIENTHKLWEVGEIYMFSPKLKSEIAKEIQELLQSLDHPELTSNGEISFILHVDGEESWSWANIRNNADKDIPAPYSIDRNLIK